MHKISVLSQSLNVPGFANPETNIQLKIPDLHFEDQGFPQNGLRFFTAGWRSA